jgi:hypothetical protein
MNYTTPTMSSLVIPFIYNQLDKTNTNKRLDMDISLSAVISTNYFVDVSISIREVKIYLVYALNI